MGGNFFQSEKFNTSLYMNAHVTYKQYLFKKNISVGIWFAQNYVIIVICVKANTKSDW